MPTILTTGDNNFGTAKWIVNATAGLGTHTTIAAAISSASSGETVFIMPGTYTENLTLKIGVDLAAYVCDALRPNVTIVGKATFTGAGAVSISGIRLQTNSDFLLAVTGSAASIVSLSGCYLNCSNNTGISFTTSSSSAVIDITNSKVDLGTTGITYYSHSSAGSLSFSYCYMGNTGSSLTSTTQSAGVVNIYYTHIDGTLTNSSTGGLGLWHVDINPGALNITPLTVGGSGTNVAYNCFFSSGTASAISVGSTLVLTDSTVSSTNTNAITGAGTLTYGNDVFSAASSKINTTTLSPLIETAFTKVVSQVFTSSGTYTPTTGMKYCIIELVGGGGGGGGSQTAATASLPGAGGGGGYARKVVTAAAIGTSQTVTIGAGGAGGAAGANNGVAGGTTSVGAIISATGGGAGNTASSGLGGSGSGGIGSGGDINIAGGSGLTGSGTGVTYGVGSTGGTSFFGNPNAAGTGNGGSHGSGSAGLNYGSGGGGGLTLNSTQDAGGAGADGVVFITEYV